MSYPKVLRTFSGKFSLKSTVNTMTCNAFTRPHIYCRLPARKKERIRLEVIRDYKPLLRPSADFVKSGEVSPIYFGIFISKVRYRLVLLV